MMTALVKINRKGQMTLPTRLRSQAGIPEGDLLEAAFRRGKIVLTPKVVLDHSRLPNADHEYTPKQRRAIDRGIAQSLEELKQGRSYGPFDSHAAFVASLRSESKKLRGKKYDESAGLWQARVTRGWRLYFTIEGDTCRMLEIKAHPK